jgi:TatD DNase family protein
MIFDSHAHYDDRQFAKDRHELISGLGDNGVGYVLNVGADVRSSEASVELAHKYDFIYASVGVHPHYADKMNETLFSRLAELAKSDKVVAIGETGLDFYRDLSDRDTQRKWYKRQLELAMQMDMPVIIHSRDACRNTLDIMLESGVKRGVIHCFAGSAEIADEYIKHGFYIGIGGVVTYRKAKLPAIVAKLPLERILLETDCPYLPPEPKRGTRNDSTNIKYIAEKIAQVKGITYDEVVSVTEKNAMELFNI